LEHRNDHWDLLRHYPELRQKGKTGRTWSKAKDRPTLPSGEM